MNSSRSRLSFDTNSVLGSPSSLQSGCRRARSRSRPSLRPVAMSPRACRGGGWAWLQRVRPDPVSRLPHAILAGKLEACSLAVHGAVHARLAGSPTFLRASCGGGRNPLLSAPSAASLAVDKGLAAVGRIDASLPALRANGTSVVHGARLISARWAAARAVSGGSARRSARAVSGGKATRPAFFFLQCTARDRQHGAGPPTRRGTANTARDRPWVLER